MGFVRTQQPAFGLARSFHPGRLGGYARAQQPAFALARSFHPGRLGDITSWWNSDKDPMVYGSDAWYLANAWNVLWNYGPNATPTPTASAPPDDGSTWGIPGSSTSDYLLNAVTGAPTNAQIAANTQTCVQAAGQMRSLYGSAVPANAEALCASDQNAFVKSIGGTAEDLLAHVLPGTSGSINWIAIMLLGGITLGIYAMRN